LHSQHGYAAHGRCAGTVQGSSCAALGVVNPVRSGCLVIDAAVSSAGCFLWAVTRAPACDGCLRQLGACSPHVSTQEVQSGSAK
jgi:hypothetical protein